MGVRRDRAGRRPRVHPTSLASCAADAGIEVVRRRSGGGTVLLVPGEILWIDVLLPRATDSGTTTSAERATGWGEVWVEALASVGVTGTEVHHGGLVCTPWCSLVCFAGSGPGEVTLGGAKLVGISQRRTRGGARFQCAVHRRWDPAAVVAPLADPRPSPADLRDLVRGVDVDLADLEAAFLGASNRSRRSRRITERQAASDPRRYVTWQGS